jgi:hypothetical protein
MSYPNAFFLIGSSLDCSKGSPTGPYLKILY